MSVQNTTPSQPGTSSQPTTQPEVPEPPIFIKGKRNSVNVIYKGYRRCGAGKSNSSTGLKADFDTIDHTIRSAIQMLGALAWVPEGEVVDACQIIKPTQSSDLAEFLQYFEKIWIGTPTSPARYPPSHWMLNEQALTSVKIVAHHRKRLPAKRRKKWLVLEKLQSDQCEAYDIDNVVEFLKFMGHTTFCPVRRYIVQ